MMLGLVLVLPSLLLLFVPKLVGSVRYHCVKTNAKGRRGYSKIWEKFKSCFWQ